MAEVCVDFLAIDVEATVFKRPSLSEESAGNLMHSVIVLKHWSRSDVVRFEHLVTMVAVRLRDQGLEVAGTRTCMGTLAPLPTFADSLNNYFEAVELLSDEDEEDEDEDEDEQQQQLDCCAAAKQGEARFAVVAAGVAEEIPAGKVRGFAGDKGSGLSGEGSRVAVLAQCAAAVALNMWTAT